MSLFCLSWKNGGRHFRAKFYEFYNEFPTKKVEEKSWIFLNFFIYSRLKISSNNIKTYGSLNYSFMLKIVSIVLHRWVNPQMATKNKPQIRNMLMSILWIWGLFFLFKASKWSKRECFATWGLQYSWINFFCVYNYLELTKKMYQ